MHIVSAADDGYLPHFAALLHSAWLYHPQAHFYLLDGGLGSENIQKLNDFARQYSAKLTIIPCATILAKKLPATQKRPLYARWLIPELLSDIDRAIYTDADTLVVGPLDELYSIDFEGRPVAAVRDGFFGSRENERKIHGIDFGDDYFNSGMMVLNLQQWRDEDIASRAFAYVTKNQKILPYPDQSALNAILRQRIKSIDKIWNFFHFHDVEKMEILPRILHLVGSMRPTALPGSPYDDLYKYHRDQTPWPFTKLPRRPWVDARRCLGAMLGIGRYKRKFEEFRLMNIVKTTIAEPALRHAKDLVARAASGLDPQATK